MPGLVPGIGKFFGKNTIDLQWKMRPDYNARPCAGEGKAAGAGTMASNEKNNAQKQSKQLEITAGMVACGPGRHTWKRPPMSSGGRHSHKSETRISAIADFACKGKRKKKALPLFPLTGRRQGV